ncbi:MAG TPA: hypothetical protein ENG40_03915, partial [Thermoprotei archaeon]|nr:hypothetical protein [Thermoprotei archaeon]
LIIIVLILFVPITLFILHGFEISRKGVEELAFVERRIFNISSDWKYIVFRGEDFQDSPPSKGWINTDLPKLIYSSGYRGAWFRKSLFIPRLNGSGRFYLFFYGVRYGCKVFVNNRHVFTHFSGFTPFKVDITSYVKQGDINEIYLCVLDWTSMLNRKINLSRLQPNERPVDRAKNSILYPIGSKYTYFGIWDDVELWIVPSIWVKDVFIKTFYRNFTIMVETVIENNYSKNIEVKVFNKILDGGKEVLTLPVRKILLRSGETVKVITHSVWNKPKLWSPWNPHLYNLSTEIVIESKVIDRRLTEFGFREFWVEDGSYYLNGIKIVLRAASTHYLDYDRENIVKTYYLLKNISVNSMRLHAQPWRRMWYRLADKIGILIIHESAVWCMGNNYRVDDPVFWKNFIKHLEGQILLHRNHPSIIIWSIENELLLTSGHRNRKSLNEVERNLAKLASIVKSLDPTRPVMFEGDFDPNGVADIINLHYPHEFPKHDQYPDTVFWLLNETILDSYPRIRWRWNRSKPLHIGEFLWTPFTSYDIPAAIFGEEAYKDPYKYYLKTKIYVWRYQIMGYRILRVNGFCPWCIFTSNRLSKPLCEV